MQFRERYDILKRLGRGSNASVFLVRDKHLDKQWAAKIFDTTHFRNRELLAVENEIRILKQVQSLDLPRIVDLYRESHQICMVMDYLQGVALNTYVKTYGPVREYPAVCWMEELCGILSQLHHMDPPILYCDLKPENIILKNEGKLALIDLGSARVLDGNPGQMPALTGSSGYTAPELFQKQDQNPGTPETLSPGADIYSVGAVGAFLVTGMHPGHWAQMKDGFSRPFVQLVDKCLSEQTVRIRDCETLKKEMKGWHGKYI
ncbi:MAG: serine/threonine protein kinase [Lachnospiraceae bacterium]